jgi:hypothetical protein
MDKYTAKYLIKQCQDFLDTEEETSKEYSNAYSVGVARGKFTIIMEYLQDYA